MKYREKWHISKKRCRSVRGDETAGWFREKGRSMEGLRNGRTGRKEYRVERVR